MNAKNHISLSGLYHENSKLSPSIIPMKEIPQKELEEFLISCKKSFPGQKNFPLRKRGKIKVSLEEVLKKRRSSRAFKNRYITFSQLSQVLSLSYGPTTQVYFPHVEKYYKFYSVPSAGGLYSCEIYLIVNKVEDLWSGIYYYNPEKLRLELIKKGKYWKNFLHTLCGQDYISKASCALVISGNFYKIKWKYGERGYRYVLLDAGHIGENIYLTATALNLGVVGICGFYDDAVNILLGLDGYNESVLYILALGVK